MALDATKQEFFNVPAEMGMCMGETTVAARAEWRGIHAEMGDIRALNPKIDPNLCCFNLGSHGCLCSNNVTEVSSVTERYGDPRFYQLLEEIAELHSRKNHDYARQDEPLSNFRRALTFGIAPWKGILVRMSDKWSRIEELSKGKAPKNESLRDSLIDNAVYSLLAVLLLDEDQ